MTTEATESAGSSSSGEFQPKILVFCCNWCSYAGADLAGVSRLQMPPNFRVIRVMCSGRVDPEHLLKAFSIGADGILVAGCHPADCHYIGGNYRTRRRIPLLKIMISQFGLEPSRLQLEWISASEGERFQQTISNFIEHIQKLGPSPVGGG
jgi:coenzyme F420-reducing hydrogenase delta subunit